MFLTSLQDKVKRIQELRRSNAAQPVRNKKKYTRKTKHKNKFEQQRCPPVKLRGRACPYGCDQYHPGKLGQDWIMSVRSAIIAIQPTKGSAMNNCIACDQETTQFVTDDGEFYYPVCGECY